MSIRTLKMLAARQRAVKLWIPANELSGNSVFDIVNGLSYADSAVIERTVANAPTVVTAPNGAITGLDSLKFPKCGVLIASWQIAVSYALQIFSLGNTSTGKGVLISPSTAIIRGADSTNISLSNAQTPSAGTNFTTALAWGADTAYLYSGQDGILSLRSSGAIPPSVLSMLAAGTPLTTTSQINSNESPFFGAMLLGWDDALPSDLVTGINWLSGAWINGDKRPYPGWND